MIILRRLKQGFTTTAESAVRPLLSINWSRLYEKVWRLSNHTERLSLYLIGRFLAVKDLQNVLIAIDTHPCVSVAKVEHNSEND